MAATTDGNTDSDTTSSTSSSSFDDSENEQVQEPEQQQQELEEKEEDDDDDDDEQEDEDKQEQEDGDEDDEEQEQEDGDEDEDKDEEDEEDEDEDKDEKDEEDEDEEDEEDEDEPEPPTLKRCADNAGEATETARKPKKAKVVKEGNKKEFESMYPFLDNAVKSNGVGLGMDQFPFKDSLALILMDEPTLRKLDDCCKAAHFTYVDLLRHQLQITANCSSTVADLVRANNSKPGNLL